MTRLFRLFYLLAIALICCYLLLPTLVVALTSVSEGRTLRFPPEGFSLQWYGMALSRPEFVDSAWLSIQVAAGVTAISVLLSARVAVEIATGSTSHLRLLTEAAASMPVVLPTIVYGPALLLVGGALQVNATFFGSLLMLCGAHLMVTLPFTLRICLNAFAAVPVAMIEAGESSGAGPLRIFFRIILPAMSAGLLAASLFGFLLSFDEPVISLFLSRQGLVTLPVQVQTYMRFRPDPTIAAISTMIGALSFVGVLLVDWLYGLKRIFGLNR